MLHIDCIEHSLHQARVLFNRAFYKTVIVLKHLSPSKKKREKRREEERKRRKKKILKNKKVGKEKEEKGMHSSSA